MPPGLLVKQTQSRCWSQWQKEKEERQGRDRTGPGPLFAAQCRSKFGWISNQPPTPRSRGRGVRSEFWWPGINQGIEKCTGIIGWNRKPAALPRPRRKHKLVKTSWTTSGHLLPWGPGHRDGSGVSSGVCLRLTIPELEFKLGRGMSESSHGEYFILDQWR